MLLCGTVLFDAYGMIDTNFFGPTFFIMLLIMTFAVEIDLPENKCRAFGGHDPFVEIADFFKRLLQNSPSRNFQATNTSARYKT
ncbi:MAG: hypothetical protein L6V83_04670 [Christensenella sp.]|nr:MAG: hypothetical protein L6V83_04670 [Christensenella sp.]